MVRGCSQGRALTDWPEPNYGGETMDVKTGAGDRGVSQKRNRKRQPGGRKQAAAKPPAPTAPKMVGFWPDLAEGERLAALAQRTAPKWGKSQWVRHCMEIQRRFEEQVSPLLPLLNAYGVRERLTLPPERRRPDELEWRVDAVLTLARERLEQMRQAGELEEER